MGAQENTRARSSSIHTSSSTEKRPVVQKKHCDLNVPPAAAAIIGKPQYYAIDELDEHFGKRKAEVDFSQYKYHIFPEPEFKRGQDYEPVRWNKIPKDLQKRLLDKWQQLGEGNNTDSDWSRLTNFLVRHIGCSHTPPDYYLNYGYYYCKGFSEVLMPQLSPKGQAWLTATSRLLQEYLEDALNSNMAGNTIIIESTKYSSRRTVMTVPRQELEISNDIFKQCAFAIHPAAYLDAGLLYLGPNDLRKIMFFIDISEWLDPATYEQIWEVMQEVPGRAKEMAEDALDATEEAVDNIGRWLDEEVFD